MASQQYLSLSIPRSLQDLSSFVAVLKNILEQLFQSAHTHILTRTTAPATSDGSIGDIQIITIGATTYLYCKNSAGVWVKVALS